MLHCRFPNTLFGLAILAAGTLAFGGAAGRLSAAPQPRLTVPESSLNAVDAASTSDAWAVGGIGRKPLALHWTGSQWKKVTCLAPKGTYGASLEAVDDIGPHQAWFGGVAERSRRWVGIIEHWDGTRCTLVNMPGKLMRGGLLETFAGSAQTHLWTAGSNKSLPHPLILEHEGSHWVRESQTPPSSGGQVFGLAVLKNSPAEAVAVGSAETRAQQPALAWEYVDGTWKKSDVGLPPSALAVVHAVAQDGHRLLAVGKDGGHSLALSAPTADPSHWKVIAPLDKPHSKWTSEAVVHGTWWAAGTSQGHPLIATYSHGTWTPTKIKAPPMYSVAMTMPSATIGWAVGQSQARSAVLLTWDGHSWTPTTW